MANPILQKLNRPQNSMSNLLQMAKGNPQGVFEQMMQTNPQFAQFVHDNQGKTPDQIAREHGINPAMLKKFMK